MIDQRTNKPRTESDRAERQARVHARIILVSRLMRPDGSIPTVEVDAIASRIGVSQRSVYRSIRVVRLARELINPTTPTPTPVDADESKEVDACNTLIDWMIDNPFPASFCHDSSAVILDNLISLRDLQDE